MTETAHQPWSVRRWFVVIGILALFQFLVIRYFGQPLPAAVIPSGADDAFAFLPPGSTDLDEHWIPRPTAFALPDADGFSGSASRWLPKSVVPSVVREAKPNFLGASRTTSLGPLAAVTTPAPAGVSIEKPARLPAEVSPVAVGQTDAVIGPTLALRRPENLVGLAPWQGEGLPGVTRVDVAINAFGEVLLASVAESSKSKNMDDLAIAMVRSWRFKPLAGAKSESAYDAKQLVWGVVTLQWAAARQETR
ncbi:MAG TPA: energy transducer TonB [Candidatus Limnocylindria bacterium]|jgi:TonB family protein|nr:energy transducer TonB [Candidatus Limnocylindria bacterium]